MERKREIQVGMTVVISLIVLTLGLLWFKQVRLSGDVSHYVVEFPTVGGLQVHDRVQVRGIRLGTVEGFEMTGDRVKVRFYVDSSADLREDAHITLTSMGIVGEMLLEIMPGEGAPVEEGHVFQGVVLKDMNAMMNEGASTLEEARKLTHELSSFLREVRGEGRLGDTMADAHATMATLRSTTADLAPDLTAVLHDLRTTTAAVQAAVAGPDSLLVGTLHGADDTLARADSLTARLSRTTDALASIVAGIEAGRGSVGRALQDDSLYAEAESTIVAVQDLIADIKARPKRYFHVSLF